MPDSLDTFREALKMLVVIYFTFNMQYPKEISMTLQLVQELCGISSFGRSVKKTLSNKSKIISLYKQILPN